MCVSFDDIVSKNYSSTEVYLSYLTISILSMKFKSLRLVTFAPSKNLQKVNFIYIYVYISPPHLTCDYIVFNFIKKHL